MFDSDSARFGVYYSVVVPRFLETGRPDLPFNLVAWTYLMFVDWHLEQLDIYPYRLSNYEQRVKSGHIGEPEKVGITEHQPVRPRMTVWWDLYDHLTANFSVNRC